jgi:cyclohexadienyl dehydratase
MVLKISWSLRASLMLLLILSANPAAARTLAAIKTDSVLKVGLTGDYAPYALRGPGGRIIGADVDEAQALARSFGVRLAIVPTTWKSMTRDFETGAFDIAMGGVSVTADRAAIGDFSMTLLSDGKRPIVRCTDQHRYSSLAAIDQPGVRVVVNPGGTNEAFDKKHFPNASLQQNPDNRAIFEELAGGIADVMVTDGVEVDYQARRHPGVLCPADVPHAFNHFDKAYWMTRDSSLRAAVNAFVKKIIDTGAYQRELAAQADRS